MAVNTPVLYYGGWACNKDDIEGVSEERGLPGGLVETEIFTNESKTIYTYTSRMLIIAPIGYRQSWYIGVGQNQTRTVEYMPGARQHIQVVALMGLKNEVGQYRSWGPIVLSCKGYQAQYMTGCMKTWKKTLEKPRKEHAPNVPPWAFWMAIGSYGDINSSMVGKSGAQSAITPINLYIPKEITLETMRKLYVGKDTVSEMAEKLQDSEEWLNAWKNRAQQAQPAHMAHDEYPDNVPPEPDFGDDIPF